MYTIIATSLFQHKKCILPGIGILKLVMQPADADFINTQIKAPQPAIEFLPLHTNSFNEFSGVSELILKRINETGKCELESVGTFTKNNQGKIQFTPETVPAEFLQPVTAERVIRQHAEHTMLVGDKETTNVVMTEYFSDTEVKRDYWWAWAVAIAAVAVALIAFNPYITTTSQLGNNHKYQIPSAGKQYLPLK